MELTSQSGGVNALLGTRVPEGVVGLAWLGQAGFFITDSRVRLLIDPYLSDRLGRKYAGAEFPHVRMMPRPLAPDAFRNIDFVLCTHGHGDHLDPDSLVPLAQANPACRFLLPRAELDRARGFGLAESCLLPVNAQDKLRLDGSLEVEVIAAAHETLVTDEDGQHRFLGFVLGFDKASLYHSGDCVVYAGLAERLRELKPDLALLPVNGRSEHLRNRGIVGNMNFEEAASLCVSAGIPIMMPMHFGMFEFNTVSPEELATGVQRSKSRSLQCVVPQAGDYYLLSR